MPNDNPDPDFTLAPGFGRRINHIPSPNDPEYIGPLLPSALLDDGGVQPLTTLREFAMQQWMDQVCSKPDWHLKVKNAQITKKWKDETLKSHSRDEFSKAMIDYCLKELKDRARAVVDPTNPPPSLVFDIGVFRSDTAVSVALKEELQAAVAAFEALIPEKEKDWHPGSDDTVWDLVHPSLFPLVYGTTRILPDSVTTLEDCIGLSGSGVTIPVQEQGVLQQHYGWAAWKKDRFSKRFQWLPCEVDINGPQAKITSYINNLHPVQHKDLYAIIERIIDAAIPLWNLTLARLDDDFHVPLRVPCSGPKYNRPETYADMMGGDESTDGDEYIPKSEKKKKPKRPPPRKLIFPEPVPYTPLPVPDPYDLRGDYGAIQVIVKLASIHLTPDNPRYEGGTWHVEGQLNEHIVSTALYYYSSENITESNLSFRQSFNADEDMRYEQGDHLWLEKYYGCENEGPAVQDMGHVETKEGRLITFPNILQHRVEPFKLKDPTRPGHRKIIALFLVDPNINIISTARVPCQQKHWWWDEVLKQSSAGSSAEPNPARESRPKGLARLPAELKQLVCDEIDGFPLSLDKAKEFRLELMKERTRFVGQQSLNFGGRGFNLCEH